MKTIRAKLSVLLAFLPLAAIAETAAPPAFFENVFLHGKVHFDLRARYEFAEQNGFDASHAATVRTRLGYSTNPAIPFSATLEFEDIRALDGDAYNQAGLNGEPRKTVVADPETTELNQAFLHFRHAGFSAQIGRQRLLLDNQRFVGNVGWRQNEQTFDALTLRYEIENGPAFLYSYLDRIHRVFSREHPAGKWDSDSHLLHLQTPLANLGTGGAYVYRLKFDQAPAMSGDTAGIWFRPTLSALPCPTTLHLEIARQTENSANPPGDFDHLYFRAELETVIDRFTAGTGFERLEGNGETAFQTPLATLHAFNGWADQFLVIPANGLDDIFLFATAKLPAKLSARTEAHRFSSERGDTILGHELDILLSRPLGAHAALLAKAALFDGKDARPDSTKFWLQTELRF